MPLIEEAKRNPTPENYLNLSLSYYQERQFEKCIEAANMALKLKPDYADAYNNMGSAYIMLGDYEKAIQACEKSIKLKPDFQLAKGNLQWAYRIKDLEKRKQSISTAQEKRKQSISTALERETIHFNCPEKKKIHSTARFNCRGFLWVRVRLL